MSLDIFSAYATDENLENNGTWFDLGGDASLLIARSQNRKYTRMLLKEADKYKKILDGSGDVADSKNDEILIYCIAETILLGWKNIKFKGKDLPYSVENAKRLLALKDFRAQVMQFANEMEAYKVKEETEQGEA